MHPWADVVPASDVESFSGGAANLDRPLQAGDHPALVLVDMTRAFVDSRYPTGWSPTGVPAVAAARQLLHAARDTGIPIFFTTSRAGMQRTSTDPEIGRWKSSQNQPADPDLPPGDVVVEDLEPLPGEIVIDKGYKTSAFFGTPLVSYLIYEGIDTTIIAGMTTSGCVRATTVDAFQYNFHVVVPHESTADRSQISHKVTLFDLHMKYADVVPTEIVLDYLARLRTPARA